MRDFDLTPPPYPPPPQELHLHGPVSTQIIRQLENAPYMSQTSYFVNTDQRKENESYLIFEILTFSLCASTLPPRNYSISI